MSNHPLVSLGRILQKADETVDILPEKMYKQVTIRLWGQGVVLRDQVEGTAIAGQKRFVVRENQFILSRIDARNGALGVVPASLDEAVVSNDFPAFSVDQSLLLPQFLNWMSKTRSFVALCKAASEGTTNRIRLKEDRFLAMEIPLPSLDEQRRIVAKIEELATKIEEARGLRREAVEEARSILDSAIEDAFKQVASAPKKPLTGVTTKIGSGSTPTGGRAAYPTSGIPFIRSMNVRMREFSWNDIAFIGDDTHKSMRATHVQPDDVLLNITGASIGRVACAPSDLVEANVNQHVAIIRPTDVLYPRYLMYWLSQPAVQDLINDEQKGATRQGFTKAQIEALEITLLPPEEQKHLVDYFDRLQTKVDSLKQLQSDTAAELDALLPSVLDKAFKGEL